MDLFTNVWCINQNEKGTPKNGEGKHVFVLNRILKCLKTVVHVSKYIFRN